MVQKGKGAYNSDVERQDIDSDSDSDDIEGFDSFSGGININNASHIEPV